MATKITHREIHKNGFLTYTILILAGILTTSIIFAISLKALKETGVWIGMILCALLTFGSLYYTEKGNRLRIVGWTILITLIIGLIAFLAGLQIISSALEGF